MWPALKGEGAGEGGIWARESVWGARGRKERNTCKGAIVFCFLRSDSERKNSDCSELIKCQSST